MPEYFIKPAADGEAEGPLTLETLKSLAAQGKISPQTPHFYDDIIGWQPIEGNSMLVEVLFPSSASKPKLTLKKNAPAPAVLHQTRSPMSVEAMLGDAQHGTAATQAQTRAKRWGEWVAGVSLPLISILCFFMGVLLVFSNWSAIEKLLDAPANIIYSPGILLAAGLLFLSLLTALAVTSVYPVVRYLSLFTLGYLGIQAWSMLYEGLVYGWLVLAAGLAFGLGLYILTLTLRVSVFGLAVFLGFGGCVSFAAYLFIR